MPTLRGYGSGRVPGRTVQIVNLLLRHACPFSGPVGPSSDARVTHLCHRGREAILEVHAPDRAELTRLAGAYETIGGEPLYEEPNGGALLLRFPRCLCCQRGRVIPSLEELGHLYLPPSTYTSSGERYQFLVPEASLGSPLGEHLAPGVEVVRVGTRPLSGLQFEEEFLVPVGTLSRDLSPRQRDALTTAILRGYYRSPRAIRSEELAREFGVSRAAFDALLRKAENKLASSLFPYLAVRGQRREAGPEPGAVPPDARTGPVRRGRRPAGASRRTGTEG